MKFFNRLEMKYRKYAIHNLMYYIVILYAVGLIIQLPGIGNPMFYWNYLSLDAGAILHGQIWRIVTFIVYPPSFGFFLFDSLFFGIIALFMYYSLGRTLESIWGAFRFNVFFFVGMLGQVLASLIGYLVFKQHLFMTTGYLNLSIFLAFAIYFPDAQFYMFFVLPVKAKWLAVAEVAVCLYGFITGNISSRVEIVIALANIILFFAMTRNVNKFDPRELRRKQKFKKQVKMMPQGKSRHKCAVCGRTEADGDLEFRYCSKCEGNYEYCQDHLYTHQHVTKGDSPS